MKKKEKKLISNWCVEENHYVLLYQGARYLTKTTIPELLEVWTKHHKKGKKYTV